MRILGVADRRCWCTLLVAAMAATGCGSEAADNTATTSREPAVPATTVPATTVPATAVPDPTTTTSSTSPSTEPSTTRPEQRSLPQEYLRFGADGVVLVTPIGEQRLVARPVGWLASDGAGGILFTDWSTERFGPTRWLGAGQTEPVVVSEWDDPVLPARVGGRPAIVTVGPTDECAGEPVSHMVAVDLVSGDRTTLACDVGGADAGEEPDSYGGGGYVGVAWDAVHPSGTSTALRLVFRDASGEVIDVPANPFPDDCSPCELTAHLSPDGTRLAVIHRPDAPPGQGNTLEGWAAESAISAELRVVELDSGDEVAAATLPAGARPASASWFDGRFVALGPDRFTYPMLQRGATGAAVAELQRRLVETGADIAVDATFGPATEAAVEALHVDLFGQPRSWVDADTWTALGVPDHVLDTATGATTTVPGSIALVLGMT